MQLAFRTVQKLDPSTLRQRLSSLQYEVCVNKGTERPFTGEYWDNHESGVYECIVCGTELFASATKFDSGTGWPSFWAPVQEGSVVEKEDRSLFMRRTEVECGNCGSHLGHVFDDGPRPTGLRYCINSASLRFQKQAP
jgi:peptide-methionine (R)-S-oxide reductase